MYEQGRGTEKNYQSAVSWYQKAAKQGHAQAQNNLAWLYESGQGVKQDLVQAYAWFDSAAHQGLKVAKQKRDLIASRLPKAKLKQAQSESKRYQQIYAAVTAQ
jgi:hypothetical protein